MLADEPTQPSPLPQFLAENVDAEVELTSQVDRLLSEVARTLHSASPPDAAATRAEAGPFLRAHGILLDDNTSQSRHAGNIPFDTARRHSGIKPIGDEIHLTGTIRTELEHARELIRRLDSERRHYRKHALRQQQELQAARREQRLTQQRATESNRRAIQLETQLSTARHRNEEYECKLEDCTEELMKLRRFIRALPPAFAKAHMTLEEGGGKLEDIGDALGLVPDRRFEEAFNDKMAVIALRRRYKQAKTRHQEMAQRLEALSMTCEDAPQYTVGRRRMSLEVGGSLGPSSSSSPTALFAGAEGDSYGTSLQLAGSSAMPGTFLLQAQSVLEFPFQLPFSPATPQDAYLKSLIHHSAFAEPLMQAREGLLRLSTRLKTTQDNGLRALYAVLIDALRDMPSESTTRKYLRHAFERQMEKQLHAQRELLFSLVAQVNEATRAIAEFEKGGGGGGASAWRPGGAAGRKQTRDVGCMAVDTSDRDYRLYQAEEQLRLQRLRTLEAESTSHKRADEAMAEVKRAHQSTLQAVAQLEALGRSVLAASRMRRLQQGDAKGAGELFDPLREVGFPLSEETLSDPRLPVKLSEATEHLITYVRQLTHSGPSTGAASHSRSKGDNDNAEDEEDAHQEQQIDDAGETASAAGMRRKPRALKRRSGWRPARVSSRARSHSSSKAGEGTAPFRERVADDITRVSQRPPRPPSGRRLSRRRHTAPCVPVRRLPELPTPPPTPPARRKTGVDRNPRQFMASSQRSTPGALAPSPPVLIGSSGEISVPHPARPEPTLTVIQVGLDGKWISSEKTTS